MPPGVATTTRGLAYGSRHLGSRVLPIGTATDDDLVSFCLVPHPMPQPPPTGVEYELIDGAGRRRLVAADLYQPVAATVGERVRHRYLHGDRPGPWSNESAAWWRR